MPLPRAPDGTAAIEIQDSSEGTTKDRWRRRRLAPSRSASLCRLSEGSVRDGDGVGKRGSPVSLAARKTTQPSRADGSINAGKAAELDLSESWG